MKKCRSPWFGPILALPLLSGIWSTPSHAQDEGENPDSERASPSASVPDDGELPPASESAQETQSPSTEPNENDVRDIPAEIQADADESGPPVDDRYNSLNDTGESLFSQIYIGPTVQIGFPNPLTYGIEVLFARTVSVGLSGGNYTVDEIDKAELKIKGWDLHARWHPFMGSFFVGASYGRMELDGRYQDEYTANISGFNRTVTAQVDASIKTNYFAPRIGWFAVWESGLCAGFDIGAQIPLGPKTKLASSFPGANPLEEAQIRGTSEYQDLEDQADEAIKVLGKRTVPTIGLLRVGWLF